METQIFCATVRVTLFSWLLVTQVISGELWQAVLMFPTTAVGVSVTGAETSTHWETVLLQLLMGHVSSGW